MVGWNAGADSQSRRRELKDGHSRAARSDGWRMRLILLCLAASIGAASVAASDSARFEDRTPDPAWKVPQVLAFVAVKKGDKIADIIGNHLTPDLARAVGPTGIVYAVETTQVAKLHPELLEGIRSLAARSPTSWLVKSLSLRRSHRVLTP